jgi:hypothetical protein
MSGNSCIDYAKAMGEWPNCSVPDCPNKSCLHLASDKCWPHTVGLPFNCHDGMSDSQIEEFNAAVEEQWQAASAPPKAQGSEER